jgi:hypothetical protein
MMRDSLKKEIKEVSKVFLACSVISIIVFGGYALYYDSLWLHEEGKSSIHFNSWREKNDFVSWERGYRQGLKDGREEALQGAAP